MTAQAAALGARHEAGQRQWIPQGRLRDRESPGCRLIGSRANGSETASSDWDFIAFGTEATLAQLKCATHLHRENVDFLVVTNGDDFRAAWGALDKSGSLSGWQWKKLSESEAEYVKAKSAGAGGSGVALTRKRAAVRVWPPLM